MLTLLLLLSTTAIAGCEFPLGDKPFTAPVIVTVTLVEFDEAEAGKLPHFGESRFARLAMEAELQSVDAGGFPVSSGQRFTFAVHSIANTFGYDHVGEKYQLGFRPREGGQDYDLVGIRVAPGAARYLRVRVQESKTSMPASYIKLWNSPQLFARAEILAADPSEPPFEQGQEVWVGLPGMSNSVTSGTVLCLALKVRAEQPEPERFRMWQTVIVSSGSSAP